MSAARDSFLQETLEFWQARTKRVLTLEDAREIAENMCSFFEILMSSEDGLPSIEDPKAEVRS
jgi:hypothetical protein